MQLGAPLGAPRTMQMCNPLACFLACFWPKSKANVHFFLAAASVVRKALTEAKLLSGPHKLLTNGVRDGKHYT